MTNVQNKFLFLFHAQNGRCALTGRPLPTWDAHEGGMKYDLNFKVDFHHQAHNSKWRRLKLPNFIDSVLNLRLVYHPAHIMNDSKLKIFDNEAKRIEIILQENKKLSDFVNNPIIARPEIMKQTFKELICL